jgi:predicted dehydrogenase
MSPASAAVGVGVIGLGFGERVHLPGWDALRDDGVRIASVCGRDGERATAAAARFGARSTTDWRELVSDPAVSVVSIATPPATHVEITAAARDAGKAVVCEKPLGLDAAAADAIAAADGPPLLVNFAFRALPELRALRERLGGAGAQEFRVTWHVATRDDATWPWSWKDDAAEGGGALALYGVHVFDYVEWLLAPIVEVHTDLKPSAATRRDEQGTPRPVTADEAFRARLVLADGRRGEVDVSLAGSRSLHRIDAGDAVLDLPVWAGQRAAPDERIEPFASHARELVAALRTGRPATPGALDGARALSLVEAARASATAGPVPVPVARGSR